jgi:ABC-type uncharacterized transport system ATPase subunit
VSVDSLISTIASSHRVKDLTVEHPPIEEIIRDYYSVSAAAAKSSPT